MSMDTGPPLKVKVYGEFACFTRPEMKVERVSYPVMTPGAARGILEAILWRPEFSWRVRTIEVLKDIRWVSLLRNEMSQRQSERAARNWAKQGGGYTPEDDRAQRHTLALYDASYIITADIALSPHTTAHPAKYRDQFRRRVERGRCFQQPYLGCREFAAAFEPPIGDEQPIDLTTDLGVVLHEIEFTKEDSGGIRFRRHGEQNSELVSGRARPVFRPARLEHGVLHVPADLYGGNGHVADQA